MPDDQHALPRLTPAPVGASFSGAADIGPSDGANRRSAGIRPTALSQNTPAVLGYLLTVGFFGLLFTLTFHAAPAANLAMLNIVLGSLGTAWIGAMAYFFGSTHGSQNKDWLLFQSQPMPPSKATGQS